MAKRNLIDRAIKSLKPAKQGQRYEVMDALVPGFGIRVTDTGRRTFILVTRYPGSRNPTRRALGEYGAVSLVDARQKARDWLELIRRGKDPGVENERHRLAEQRKRANSFAAVAEDFITTKLPKERKGGEIERDIRRDLIPAWGGRPISDISRLDIRNLIQAKAKSAPSQARNLLATIKRLFAWAVDQEVYNLPDSPAVSLKPANVIGERPTKDRILTDDEMFALWRVAGRFGYPFGPVYRLLMLTGLRLYEAAGPSWGEIDLRQKIWTIPATRMKGMNAGSRRARDHVVPLTADILALLDDLPKFKSGDYVFSTTFGASPVWMASYTKKRVDAEMLRVLRAFARQRGENPEKVTLPHWTNHDIRRTVRSGLSRLKIAEEVREAVLAHVRPGIKGVYDKHDYLDEKREALELWAARLRSIVSPTPDNVVPIKTRAM